MNQAPIWILAALMLGGTAQAQSSVAAHELPVNRVVLYKNGVGFFEHTGKVAGADKVSIDFTSAQLDDVLASLTVLDEGGGRIGGVNYNSTMPLAEQLRSLSLGLGADPTETELFRALRGARVEVSGVGTVPISGRLVSIEAREEKSAGSVVKHNVLTLVTSSGAVRSLDLNASVGVRPLDAALAAQLDRYLQLLADAHQTGLRHLTLNSVGEGTRTLRVSYISEVPVWKSTYRIVFPEQSNGHATLQGWAVVDNTVGVDWNNVALTLVAGAPQSFVAPLSEPLYNHRPTVPIATVAQDAPETHAQGEQFDRVELAAKLAAPPPAPVGNTLFGSAVVKNRMQAIQPALGRLPQGIYRPTDVATDVTTQAVDDFFSYALKQPVTIRKNESAMVPILQQDLPVERVTLWSPTQPHPLRALWMDNNSALTMDAGSFTILEGGAFAGEGLLDVLHPGERRLLSYAADQAVKVRIVNREQSQHLRSVRVVKGTMIETAVATASVDYEATNADDQPRTVLIEHPRHEDKWSLNADIAAAETTPSLYRFRLTVPAHGKATLHVGEFGPDETRVQLNNGDDQQQYLLSLIERVPDARQQLEPLLAVMRTLAEIDGQMSDQQQIVDAATQEEERDRENLTALKGSDASRRFADALSHAEDRLQAATQQLTLLGDKKKHAEEQRDSVINNLSAAWSIQTK